MDAEVTRLPSARPDHGTSASSARPATPSSAPAAISSTEDVAALASALGQVDAAHRRLRTRVAHRLGVTVTDLTALVVISDVGGATPKLLASEMGLTTGSVTSLIDRLVKAGQVRRAPNGDDRRSVLVELTADGDATIEVVSGLYLGAIGIALDAAPHVFNRHILDSLRHTADALDGAADGGADGSGRLGFDGRIDGRMDGRADGDAEQQLLA